jgi:hypothetical protein
VVKRGLSTVEREEGNEGKGRESVLLENNRNNNRKKMPSVLIESDRLVNRRTH